MRLRTIRGLAAAPRRGGFSLVEMLIVIAIIGVLATLAFLATMAVVENRRQGNTETNISTLNKLLQAHWKQVREDAWKETPSTAVQTLAANSNGTTNMERARVIWTEFRLMEAFPISYSEVQNIYSNALLGPYIPAGSVATPRKYNATYKGKLGALTAANNSLTESSACLILALSINRGVQPITDKDARQEDLDQDGMPEILDSWSQPIRFYRFPTANTGLNSAAPASLGNFRDSIDPKGFLLDPNWTAAHRATFESLCHKISAAAGTPPSYYVIPVLVSAGRDNQFGLQVPPDGTMLITNAAQNTDNIYSYNLTGD